MEINFELVINYNKIFNYVFTFEILAFFTFFREF